MACGCRSRRLPTNSTRPCAKRCMKQGSRCPACGSLKVAVDAPSTARPTLMQKRVVVLASVLLLGGCSGVNEWMEGKVEYKTASTLPPLEVPPDLTSPARDNR